MTFVAALTVTDRFLHDALEVSEGSCCSYQVPLTLAVNIRRIDRRTDDCLLVLAPLTRQRCQQ
jgi:hypothetical protein